MTGGKYLAEERGAFEVKSVGMPQLMAGAQIFTPDAERECPVIVSDVIEPARAPLYEFAAQHDGQPAAAWLGYFMARF